MSFEQHIEAHAGTRLVEKDFKSLALEALSKVARSGGSGAAACDNELFLDFCRAFVDSSESRRTEILSRLMAAGVSAEQVVDIYVPRAARWIGEEWVADRLEFSEVTVGASRLQELVRAFGAQHDAGSATVRLGQSILMIVPASENHTMGACLAATQFRRYGVWVHLALGQNAQEIAHTVRSAPFSMVGVSCASPRSVREIKAIVRSVRENDPMSAPVVLGGNVENIVDDLKDATGVDHVCSNTRKAMALCGLTARNDVINGFGLTD